MESEKCKYVPPIPGKQGHNSNQGVANIQSEAAKNPEYDVLPLRTFHNTPYSRK